MKTMHNRLKLYYRLFCVLLIIMGQTAVAAGLPVAKITAKVIYEDGSPVERITVNAGFSLPYNAWADSYKGYSKSARTNKDGNASFEGRTASGISLGIREEGYYRTTNGLPYLFNEIKDGKWQPWNPAVEMVLKPILKPIPMYAKRVETKIPVIGETVGFDLVASDWIAPHGKGKIADFIIKMKKQYMSVNQPFEVTLTMCFSNEDDGIQSLLAPINVGSELRLPRYAPENGYMPELVKSNSRKSVNAMIERDYRDDQNYFFRVRTVKKNGKIISAYYGKIDGDIEFWGNEKLRFTYYLNPTPNDRNMEFDPKRNLLTGLKDDEAVFNP